MANTITPSHLYPAPDSLTHTTMDRLMASIGVSSTAATLFPVISHKHQGRHPTSNFLVHYMLYTFFDFILVVGGGLATRDGNTPVWWLDLLTPETCTHFGRNCFFSAFTILFHFCVTDERSTEPCFVVCFVFSERCFSAGDMISSRAERLMHLS